MHNSTPTGKKTARGLDENIKIKPNCNLHITVMSKIIQGLRSCLILQQKSKFILKICDGSFMSYTPDKCSINQLACLTILTCFLVQVFLL